MLFENFGKKISKVSENALKVTKEVADSAVQKTKTAAESAVQKTKSAADSAKLNVLINDEEKKLRKVYAELGEAYCRLYKENPDSEFLKYIDEVNRYLNKINALNAELKELKGGAQERRCEKCGEAIPADSNFCPVCGEKTES